MMDEIKFIKYTGEYPCLCSGMLIITVNGEEYGINGWKSGGEVYFDDDWNDFTTEGDWTIDIDSIPDELKHLYKEIIRVMNENVEKGCCGGCL